jgi:hypothetical protein
MVPGDKLSIIDRVASDQDVSRFPEHYAKYKQGQHQDVVGTRLEVVPWLSRSQVEEYKFFSILTVEQLAAASDSVGQKFPGFYGDRDKAIKFLEQTTGVNARMTELEETVKRLTEQLAVKNDAEKAYQDSKKEPSKKG